MYVRTARDPNHDTNQPKEHFFEFYSPPPTQTRFLNSVDENRGISSVYMLNGQFLIIHLLFENKF